ncbi:MAG: sigma-70 family RNA polymerase sigma factor [Pseudomonadota bacterium]
MKKQVMKTKKELASVLFASSGKGYSGEDSLPLSFYLKGVGYGPLLTAVEERKHLKRAKAGDSESRNTLLLRNLRLVIKIAKCYCGRGVSFSDLISEGNLGLLHAIEKFDLTKDNRFSTYATWWIRENIESALMNQCHVVRLPVHVAKALKRLHRDENELTQILQQEPTMQELSKFCNSSEKAVNKLKFSKGAESLEELASEHDATDTQAHPQLAFHPVTQEVSHDQVYVELLNNLLCSTLSECERNILMQRFGLCGHKPMTLEEVAKVVHMRSDQVRKIQISALTKIKGKLIEDGYDIDALFN